MKTETNKTFTFAWGTAAVAADTAFIRRAASRRLSLTRISPRPLCRTDLGAFRRAESRLLTAIQSDPVLMSTHRQASPADFVGQKRELVLLLLYAAALLLMVAAAFLDSGSFVERWAEFVDNVRGF